MKLLLTAARQAAEEALRHASSGNMSSDHADAVSLLANDLKSLDILARKSDDRNAKTFEAIHDTLLKIVDRLGSLEDRKPAFAASPVEQKPVRVTIPVQEEDFEPVFAPQHVAPKIDLGASAPMLDIPDAENALETHEDFSPVPVRSPAEAAMAAANAAREMAVAIEAKDGIAKPAGGLFSGLTNALRRKGKTEISADILPGTLPAKIEAPLIVGPLAGSEPVVANEANPGAPDLNAIMKRVRDERRGRTDGGSDASAKNDFLAAARRAAQAAAADAEILKNKNAKAAKTGKSGLADIVQRQRKPILMGALAIMLALTGLQLGKAFMGGTPDQGVVSDAAPAVSQTESEKTSALPKAGELEMQKSADPVAAPSLAPLAPTNDESKVRVVEPVAETASAAKAMMTDKVTEAPQAEAVANQTDTATLAPQTAPANPSDASSEAIPADTGPIALREAAASGDAKALFEIGSRYADGRGVAKDPKKAVEWYQKAADAGFAPAQFRLGSLYEKGIGVERTPAKAKMLYQLAAEQGNASAMHNLAVLFAMGAAGPTDNDSAARWFVKAAELGVKDSQYNLGILAAKGLGVHAKP